MHGNGVAAGHRARPREVLAEVAVGDGRVGLGQVDRVGDIGARKGRAIAPFDVVTDLDSVRGRAGPAPRRGQPREVLVVDRVIQEQRLVKQSHRAGVSAPAVEGVPVAGRRVRRPAGVEGLVPREAA